MCVKTAMYVLYAGRLVKSTGLFLYFI